MILAAKKKKDEQNKQVSTVVAEAKAAQKRVQNKKAEFKEIADKVDKVSFY